MRNINKKFAKSVIKRAHNHKMITRQTVAKLRCTKQ